MHDLMAVGKDISEGEQVLNVIQALSNKPEHLIHVKTVLTPIDHLKTFAKIQGHVEMEEEHMKMFSPPKRGSYCQGK